MKHHSRARIPDRDRSNSTASLARNLKIFGDASQFPVTLLLPRENLDPKLDVNKVETSRSRTSSTHYKRRSHPS